MLQLLPLAGEFLYLPGPCGLVQLLLEHKFQEGPKGAAFAPECLQFLKCFYVLALQLEVLGTEGFVLVEGALCEGQ